MFAFGDSEINVHPPEFWQDPAMTLRGPHAVSECGDFCACGTAVEGAGALFHDATGGLVERPIVGQGGGSLARASAHVTRLGNLLELIVYK